MSCSQSSASASACCLPALSPHVSFRAERADYVSYPVSAISLRSERPARPGLADTTVTAHSGHRLAGCHAPSRNRAVIVALVHGTGANRCSLALAIGVLRTPVADARLRHSGSRLEQRQQERTATSREGAVFASDESGLRQTTKNFRVCSPSRIFFPIRPRII